MLPSLFLLSGSQELRVRQTHQCPEGETWEASGVPEGQLIESQTLRHQLYKYSNRLFLGNDWEVGISDWFLFLSLG